MKPLTPSTLLHENQLQLNGTECGLREKTGTRHQMARMPTPMYSIAIRIHWVHAVSRIPR
jgi:hypothetical protein